MIEMIPLPRAERLVLFTTCCYFKSSVILLISLHLHAGHCRREYAVLVEVAGLRNKSTGAR